MKNGAAFDDNLPIWINCFRAWLAVDPQRARQCLPDKGTEQRREIDQEAVRLFLEAGIACVLGDWERVDCDLLLERPWARSARVQSMRAFWYAVQERHEEAATALARAEPIPEFFTPPVMGATRRTASWKRRRSASCARRGAATEPEAGSINFWPGCVRDVPLSDLVARRNRAATTTGCVTRASQPTRVPRTKRRTRCGVRCAAVTCRLGSCRSCLGSGRWMATCRSRS